jgi:hypothetical protein
MGFKRTSEGRVFFSGSGEASNDEARFDDARMKKAVLTDPDDKKASAPLGQLQVLSLLKSLNEKLQLSQIERSSMRQELESYRKLVESLEEKSRATDKAYQGLESRLALPDMDAVLKAEAIASEAMAELAKTRAMMAEFESRTERVDRNVTDLLGQSERHKQVSVALSKKQVELDRKFTEQSERIANGVVKYKELLGRVENTENKFEMAMEKQDRFLMRLEQESHERAAFMQRIEQKALLINGPEDMPRSMPRHDRAALLQPHPADRFAQNEAADSLGRRFVMFWSKPMPLKAPFVLVAGIGLLIAGWAMSDVQKPALPNLNWNPLFSGDKAPVVQEQGTSAWQSSSDVSSFTGTETIERSSFDGLGLKKDVAPALEGNVLPGDADLEKMGEMIDTQQADAVALALNSIEPGVTTSDAAIQEDVPLSREVENSEAAPVQEAALPEDVKKIEKLAMEGVAEAQHDLAAIYVTGHGGVTQNYEKAALWFDKAAQGGIANAAYNLGVLYHQGLGVTKDLDTAIRWYESAAEMDHPEAQYNLGIAYIEGIGVEYDPAVASLHFESAAQKGVREAAYNLGLIYENALLGAARPDEALMWYKTAADAGSAEAQSALAQLAKSLNIEMKDIDRIVNDVRAKRGGAATVSSAAEPVKAAAPVAVKPKKVVAPVAQKSTVKAVAPRAPDASSVTPQGQALVKLVQSFLMDAGLYPGPADGQTGPLTQDAIRSYQSIHKLKVDGAASPELLSHMKSQI